MDTENTNKQSQLNQSSQQNEPILNSILNQKGNFLIMIGAISLILIVGTVAYYLGTTKNSKQMTISKTPQQIVSPSQQSSNLESPEQILASLEKTLSVNSPITDQKSKNWTNNDKQVVPLKGKSFGIGTFKNAYMDKYGNFPSLPDGNPDLSKIDKSSLEPLRKQVDNFFINNGFTMDTLNTKEIAGFENLYGYTLGDIHCLVSLFPQSIPFGQFFCGVLDPDELSWWKELVPIINPKNAPNTYFSVNKLIGNYARGGVGGYAGGVVWYAVKIDGKWKEVWTGQNIISCTPVKQYNIPKEIYGNDCSTGY